MPKIRGMAMKRHEYANCHPFGNCHSPLSSDSPHRRRKSKRHSHAMDILSHSYFSTIVKEVSAAVGRNLCYSFCTWLVAVGKKVFHPIFMQRRRGLFCFEVGDGGGGGYHHDRGNQSQKGGGGDDDSGKGETEAKRPYCTAKQH